MFAWSEPPRVSGHDVIAERKGMMFSMPGVGKSALQVQIAECLARGLHEARSVPPGDPESRQYRGILQSKNKNVGNLSPIYTVVTTP